MKLQPAIFWYDSQHVAHVDRYLQIFTPYANLDEELRLTLGKPFINSMRLRVGDFIEDRFGQAQRTSLSRLAGDRRLMLKLFDWFGCYLVWDSLKLGCSDGMGGDDGQDNAEYERRLNHKTREYVVHLRGRGADLSRVAQLADRVLRDTRVECPSTHTSEACPSADDTYACTGT